MNCGRLPTTERIRTSAANVAKPMTRKILISPLDFAAYTLGNGRTLAWYLARRLQRA